MSRPILINGTKESIRLEVPAATAVSQIVNDIGKDTPIKIIEVGSQSEIEGYTIGDFASYLNERTTNHKVLNLISLEVSNTPLNSKVSSPRIVRFVDWIDIVWPIERRSRGDYPQVQKYCLTGMAGSYTDFHIGTSSYLLIIPLFSVFSSSSLLHNNIIFHSILYYLMKLKTLEVHLFGIMYFTAKNDSFLFRRQLKI